MILFQWTQLIDAERVSLYKDSFLCGGGVLKTKLSQDNPSYPKFMLG
jgi:hypothetical protein